MDNFYLPLWPHCAFNRNVHDAFLCLTELVTKFFFFFSVFFYCCCSYLQNIFSWKRKNIWEQREAVRKRQVCQEDKQVRVLDLPSASRRTLGGPHELLWPQWFKRELRRRPAVFTSSNRERGSMKKRTANACGSGRGSWKGISRNGCPVVRGRPGAAAEALRLRFLPWGLWHAHHRGSPDLSPSSGG